MLTICRCDWCQKELRSWKTKEIVKEYIIALSEREYLCQNCYQTTLSERRFNFCSFKCLRDFANNYETCKHEEIFNYTCKKCGKFMLKEENK